MPDIAVTILIPLRIALVSPQRHSRRFNAPIAKDHRTIQRPRRHGPVRQRRETVVHNLRRRRGCLIVGRVIRARRIDLRNILIPQLHIGNELFRPLSAVCSGPGQGARRVEVFVDAALEIADLDPVVVHAVPHAHFGIGRGFGQGEGDVEVL